jgi:hypothetical protein
MSTSTVSTSPYVAARATSATSADARRCDARSAYASVIARSCAACSSSSALDRLSFGNGRGDQMRVAVHRPVDGVHRFAGGEDQRDVEPAEERPQGLVDLPCVLAHVRLLAFGALQTAARRAVLDRRLAGCARHVFRQVGDPDLLRLELRRELEQPNAAL